MEKSYDKSVDVYLFGLLAYELMTGVPTFRPELPDLEYCILNSQFQLPMDLTPEARDLLTRLIVTDPKARPSLKSLKKHPFFAKIDWRQAGEGK